MIKIIIYQQSKTINTMLKPNEVSTPKQIVQLPNGSFINVNALVSYMEDRGDFTDICRDIDSKVLDLVLELGEIKNEHQSMVQQNIIFFFKQTKELFEEMGMTLEKPVKAS